MCRKIQLLEPNGHKRLEDVITGDETWIYFYGIPKKRQNMMWVAETWIYFYGIPKKRQNMMWVAEDEPRPVVTRKGFQSRKRLFTIFF